MGSGLIAVFGSGETSRRGRQVHDFLFARLPVPVRVVILETPAGFQPNVSVVTDKLRTFFERQLQNYQPQVGIVPARQRGGLFDPDLPSIAAPLNSADYIFAGPGSPTYAVRQLAGTLTWATLRQRLADGAIVSLASAAAIAASRFALPVYEIYKVGDDLHWLPGLDLFSDIGLNLTIMPHWNNSEGGTELDTSHCFVGADRFRYLRRMLPPETTVLAVDEHTACVLDPAGESGLVMGAGGVTVIRGERELRLASGERFPFRLLRA